MIRRKLSRPERREVYDKMGGHCAYCGCDLRYEDMQVDHVIPVAGLPVNGRFTVGDDTIDNMLPACRSCNHYKSTLSISLFRKMIEQMPATLARDSVTYKNAVRYGLVVPNPGPVTFFFERRAARKEGT